jgi:DNA-binding NarL/FixJ family response regulator
VINFIFIWKSCVVDDRDDMQRMQSAEQKMNAVIEKYGLSQREKEIAELIFHGKNNKEIAGLLYLSPNTVKVHASNLYRKLGVINRVQAAAVLRGEEVPHITEETEEE